MEMAAMVVAAAEELVQRVMGAWDSSHDPFHALRVRDLALSLAAEEGLPSHNLQIVELAALLHDIDDHKYASARDKGQDGIVEGFLREKGLEADKIHAVMSIITSMGFKEELEGPGKQEHSPEFAVVQDADRLDAIGAIDVCPAYFRGPNESVGVMQLFTAMQDRGVARAFTFGGSRNRVMYDPAQAPRTGLTKAQYVSGDAKPTTINHFHEKLLRLKDLMKSKAGKQRAEERHKFMLTFLQQFEGEWNGRL